MCFSLLLNGLERNSEHFFLLWKGFVAKLRSSECFSLLGNGFEWKSKHFYLPQSGSEQYYEVPSVLSSTKWFGMEFLVFFFFRGMARNGIASFFRSAKQAEFRRNELKFMSIPCSAE